MTEHRPLLLLRYLSVERQQVWEELCSRGDYRGWTTPFLDEARAVASETMRRARHNVELLVQRLLYLGYRFDNPESAFLPPISQVDKEIDALERHIGPLPLSLRSWYQTVGHVDLTGWLPGTHKDRRKDWPGYPDPLVVYGPSWEGFTESIVDDYDDRVKWGYIGDAFQIDIAPDYWHKENVSGGAPYGLAVPGPLADAALLNEWHETTFVRYLRIAFAWGGFPGLGRPATRFEPAITPPPGFLEHLREGLLPL
jgi:hypothetical protein